MNNHQNKYWPPVDTSPVYHRLASTSNILFATSMSQQHCLQHCCKASKRSLCKYIARRQNHKPKSSISMNAAHVHPTAYSKLAFPNRLHHPCRRYQRRKDEDLSACSHVQRVAPPVSRCRPQGPEIFTKAVADLTLPHVLVPGPVLGRPPLGPAEREHRLGHPYLCRKLQAAHQQRGCTWEHGYLRGKSVMM